MAADPDDNAPWIVRSVVVPSLLIVLSIVLLAWSATFNETARQVPMLVAGTMLVLSVFDFVCRYDVPALRPLRDFWGADFHNREMRHNPRWTAEAAQVLWMVGCVAAMLLIGILPAVPAFVFLYMIFNGRRPLVEGLVVAAAVFAFVYIVFEVLLDYELYRGALFSGRGFSDW